MLNLQAGNQFFFEKSYLENETIVSKSQAMQAVLNDIQWLKDSNQPVLILGQAGSGKELLAREIFKKHINKTHSFLKVNLSGLSVQEMNESLFNSHAHHPGKGFLKKFSGNTVFLKGIESLDFSIQLKLLKCLKSSEYKALEKSLSIRLICAGSNDLPDKVKEGDFHEELFQHVSRHLVMVPDLRERTQDIPELVHYYLSKSNFNGDVDTQVLDVLKNYSWQRNVAELKQLCDRLSEACFGQESIKVSDLPLNIRESGGNFLFIKYNPHINLEKVKTWYIKLALDHFKCKKQAARALGISVKTIYNREMPDAFI